MENKKFDEMAIQSNREPAHEEPGVTREAAPQQESSSVDLRPFVEEMRQRYPIKGERDEQDRATVRLKEVLTLLRDGQLDRGTAEERWKAIVVGDLPTAAKPDPAEATATPPANAPPASTDSASAEADAAATDGAPADGAEAATVQPAEVTETPQGAAEPAQAAEAKGPPASRGEAPPAADPTTDEKRTQEMPAEALHHDGPKEPEKAEEPAEAEAPEPQAPPKRVKAEWKILSPKDSNDPVDLEIEDHRERNDRWSIAAASVRGKLHAHEALHRDDAFSFSWVDEWTVIAVSDGAGSARISRVGARIACDESVKTLTELLSGYCVTVGNDGQASHSDLVRLRAFLAEGARKAQRGILREAQQRQCSERDLHATLLLLIHAPVGEHELIGAIQIGDGAVGVLTGDDNCTVLGVADHGEFSSETRFLTTRHIEYEFEGRVNFSFKKDVRCLAAMCDGVSDDFFPEHKRLIELFVADPIGELKTRDGEPVRGVMHSVLKQPDAGKALLDWLGYEKKGSSDDRTLVLMYRSDLL